MFETIYQGMDPRLANLDAATFRSLYDQYNGALQMWGQDAANAVFQKQLAGLPQSPVGAGSTGGPQGRGGAPMSVTNPSVGGAGSTNNLGGRRDFTQTDTGATNLGDIASAAMGGAAANIAPNNLGGRRDFTATDTGAGIPAASNNLQGRRDFTTADTGATGVPATTIPATTAPNLDNQFTGNIFSPTPAPTEAAVLDWLGTEGAANLLGTGGGGGQAQTPIEALPIGDAVPLVDPNAGGGGGMPPAGDGGFMTPETPINYGGMSGYDLKTTLADIEHQMGRVDEQKLMQTSDLNRAKEQAERALPGQFNRRGMLNSGLYHRGEGRLAEAAERQRGRAEYGFGESYDALSRAAASAEGGASQSAVRTTMTDAQRQASMAANIRDLGVY